MEIFVFLGDFSDILVKFWDFPVDYFGFLYDFGFLGELFLDCSLSKRTI